MDYYYAIYRCKYCEEEFGNIVGDETKNTVHRCLADFIGIEIVEDK
jgi:hypothetical protein